eukprot:gb/GECG01007276.1/.p1 GENE.gb/GECG01007276.1/~~gb/GECG01007276.1/.p1  ORF type:complete len:364 (+),score=36.61 gb/GECG01007276.1/:1-1092(+)
MITSSVDMSSRLWDVKEMRCLKRYVTNTPLNTAAISPLKEHVLMGGGQEARDVTTTAAGAGKFETRFFDMVTENEFGRVKGHFGPLNTLAFHPSGHSYASGAEDGYVRLHHFDQQYYDLDKDKDAADVDEATIQKALDLGIGKADSREKDEEEMQRIPLDVVQPMVEAMRASKSGKKRSAEVQLILQVKSDKIHSHKPVSCQVDETNRISRNFYGSRTEVSPEVSLTFPLSSSTAILPVSLEASRRSSLSSSSSVIPTPSSSASSSEIYKSASVTYTLQNLRFNVYPTKKTTATAIIAGIRMESETPKSFWSEFLLPPDSVSPAPREGDSFADALAFLEGVLAAENVVLGVTRADPEGVPVTD